jgi:ferredoxin
MSIRVTIDRPECISCGSCWADCPEFFEENTDDHWSEVVSQFREDGNLGMGNAPPHLGNCVKQAEEDCPVGIIHVES